jgi:hypothetical protein
MPNRVTYAQAITQRLEFLDFINKNLSFDTTLSFDVIGNVWKELVENSLVRAERDLVFAWFAKLVKTSTFASAVIGAQEELLTFFEERVCRPEYQLSMSEAGFACFRAVFASVNLNAGALAR